MYKNVFNQYTLGIILSFPLSFDVNAQITGTHPVTYANAGLRSDHPPAESITTKKTVERLWANRRLTVWELIFKTFRL